MPRQPDPRPGSADVYPLLASRLERMAFSMPSVSHFHAPLERMLAERVQEGREKYGTLLQTNNGRDAILDAWQEAADLCFYLQQALAEGDRVETMLNDACHLLFALTRLRVRIQQNREVMA